MEPRIQYAKTSDGVSIAYWTLGEGDVPLVLTSPHVFNHIQLEWQTPETRRWCERLAEKRQLVGYDGRGSGLSDRDVLRYSLDTLVLDLEAVVGRLGLQAFDLFGDFVGGQTAIACACRHPKLVSHLILWNSYARASDVFRSPTPRE